MCLTPAILLRRIINNAAGERSEPAASEAGAVGFNASLGRRTFGSEPTIVRRDSASRTNPNHADSKSTQRSPNRLHYVPMMLIIWQGDGDPPAFVARQCCLKELRSGKERYGDVRARLISREGLSEAAALAARGFAFGFYQHDQITTGGNNVDAALMRSRPLINREPARAEVLTGIARRSCARRIPRISDAGAKAARCFGRVG